MANECCGKKWKWRLATAVNSGVDAAEVGQMDAPVIDDTVHGRIIAAFEIVGGCCRVQYNLCCHPEGITAAVRRWIKFFGGWINIVSHGRINTDYDTVGGCCCPQEK